MIIIKKEKESLILKRHPWLYSKAIHKIIGNPENGDIVPVCSPDNKVLCHGFYSPGSLISIRIISFGADKPEREWMKIRIKNAYDLRKSLRIPSNGYRLINAEGDFLPGLIVDIYNKTTVVRPLIKGIEKSLSTIIDTLVELYPENCIFIKRDEFSARKEDITIKNGYIHKSSDGTEIIEENGLHFYTDIISGQKTGFYFDLRDARILASGCTFGKKVLNLFSYTGAFAIHAAKGGAKTVISVEQSKQAIEYAQKNEKNNPGLSTNFEWIQGDVFDFLPSAEDFDVIILDPPPFARKKQEVQGALKGYSFLNMAALKHLSKKGWLFTFSCSHAINKELFLQTLSLAAIKTGRDIRIIRELHSAPDHPFSIVHPEGEYLKGWALYVD